MAATLDVVIERPIITPIRQEVSEQINKNARINQMIELTNRFRPNFGPPEVSYLDSFVGVFLVEMLIPKQFKREAMFESDTSWAVLEDGDSIRVGDIRLEISRAFDQCLRTEAETNGVHSCRQTFGGGAYRFYDELIRAYTKLVELTGSGSRRLCLAYRRKLCVGIGHFIRP